MKSNEIEDKNKSSTPQCFQTAIGMQQKREVLACLTSTRRSSAWNGCSAPWLQATAEKLQGSLLEDQDKARLIHSMPSTVLDAWSLESTLAWPFQKSVVLAYTMALRNALVVTLLNLFFHQVRAQTATNGTNCRWDSVRGLIAETNKPGMDSTLLFDQCGNQTCDVMFGVGNPDIAGIGVRIYSQRTLFVKKTKNSLGHDFILHANGLRRAVRTCANCSDSVLSMATNR